MNLSQVQTYLSLVYPSQASRIALCLIPPDRGRPEHRWTTAGGLSRFLSYAAYRNARGWGVYVTPSVLTAGARSRRKASFLQTQQVIYLDCDRAGCLAEIEARYPYPTLVVRTSRGRHQVYWRLHPPVNVADQERLMSAMAVDVDADRAATDVSRVLRLPGFWNRKADRHNTVDVVFTRRHAVSYQSLCETLPLGPSTDSSTTTVTGQPQKAAPVLGDVCDVSAVYEASGRRTGLSQSEIDWYEVHRRLDRGDAPQEIILWLQQHRADKPNPTDYAARTVRNALATRTPKQ